LLEQGAEEVGHELAGDGEISAVEIFLPPAQGQVEGRLLSESGVQDVP
jgi:hypothetical protein